MLTFSVIGLVISVVSIVITVRNYWWTRYASVRENQARLRFELKERLHPFDYWRIEKTLNQLRDRNPSTSIEEDLRNLRDHISFHKDEFVAPTPNQLQSLADTIETTRRAYDATRQPPTDDRIFDAEHEANQRKELIKQFERLRGEMRCVVAGLNEIQK
ncbi:MAG: hypothetical protein QOE89_452 [Pseudonocardiales bacterium]|nr:hypothetical protein [Pseudonocardiales bacterium]